MNEYETRITPKGMLFLAVLLNANVEMKTPVTEIFVESLKEQIERKGLKAILPDNPTKEDCETFSDALYEEGHISDREILALWDDATTYQQHAIA